MALNYQHIEDFVFDESSPKEELFLLCREKKFSPHLQIEEGLIDPFSPLPQLEVRFINQDLGFGVFAKERIEKNRYLSFYAGRLGFFSHSKQPGDYYHAYPVTPSYGLWKINAEPAGNITRFYNHSFHPNLFKKWVLWKDLIYPCFFAKETILEGEELRYNYGNNYWLLRGCPK